MLSILRRPLAAAALLATAATSAIIAAPATALAATGTSQAVACSALTMKPYVTGSTARKFEFVSGRNEASAAMVSAVTLQFDWSALEKSRGVYDFSQIDAQLGHLQSKGLSARLRIAAGVAAPTYVKNIGGAALPFYDHDKRVQTTIGRFWTNAYQARWQALMTKLAARYDNNETLREVNISGTGMISSEVFLLLLSDKVADGRTHKQVLQSAGLTDAARDTALWNDVTFMHRTWRKTHTTLFFHSYQSLGGWSVSKAEQLITRVHEQAPGHTVFGHTGTSTQLLFENRYPQATRLYDYIQNRNYPFMTQTQPYGGGVLEPVGDMSLVMDWAGSHKIMSVELPAMFQRDTTLAKPDMNSYLTSSSRVQAANADTTYQLMSATRLTASCVA